MNPKFKNRLFIALVVATSTIGNLFLAIGMERLPDFSTTGMPMFLLAFLSNGWILGGTALMAAWMVAQLSMYTWADLTYVLPVTASAYIFTAILGEFVLGEHVSALRWAGIAVISLGVMFVSETPVDTPGKAPAHATHTPETGSPR